MNFTFECGIKEKHSVEFKFNQFLGNLSITIDKKRKISDFRFMSFNLTKAYEFSVGDQEVHEVRIEKIRKLVFAGFRTQIYKVFIDKKLTHEYEGR